MGILTYRHACYWLLVVGHATCFNFSSTRSRLEYDEFGAVDIQSDSEPQVDGGLSPIRKMAAIGDSYSAGIGAGDRLGDVSQALDKNSDWACSRYDHAYPYVVNSDPRLGDNTGRTFEFKSCSGAVAQDVATIQIPALTPGQQVILLTVGGNDAELTNVLNQCIYQWAVFTKAQAAVAKAAVLDADYKWAEDIDWDTLSRGCADQLEHSRSIIESDEFATAIEAVLALAITKLADDGVIYFTGYGKFFDEEYTNECSTVSWSTWISKAWNSYADARLTYDLRRVMNGLVDRANAELKSIAANHPSNVIFIDYDSYIGKWGGRFCEPGVDESTKESNTRPHLMFYELDSIDAFATNPWKRSTNGDLSGTFAGQLDMFAEITRQFDPHTEFRDKEIDDSTTGTSTLASSVLPEDRIADIELPDLQVPNVLPDGYGRVFHPQVLLHQIISNLVVWNINNVRHAQAGQLQFPQDLKLDSCPTGPGQDVPLDDTPHCDHDLDNIESDLFRKIVGRYCADHGDLTQHSNAVYTAQNVGDNRYPGWQFDLIWSPGGEAAQECQHSCGQIFDKFIDNCAYTSHALAKSGILQVDYCGEAFYTVVPPSKDRKTPDDEVKLLSCTPAFTHPDTWAEQQAEGAAKVCVRHAYKDPQIYRDTPSTYVAEQVWTKKPFEPIHKMHYNIWWKKGCILESGSTSVPIDHPILKPGAPSCTKLLTDAYVNCTNNGGAGGQIQVGCLIYEYVPQG